MLNKYVLITGGAGYIGSHLTEFLIKKKYKVLVVDNFSNGKKEFIHQKAKFEIINLLNKKTLFFKLKKYKISSIIHLASNIDVFESEKKPNLYLKDNVKMTSNILDYAKKKGINNFIFSSTAAVYGDIGKTKVSESDEPKPKSNYGLGKLMCEEIIQKNCEKSKINYSILRFFNVVGSNFTRNIGPIKSGNLFKNLSSNIIKKKYEINVYGKKFKTRDGSAIRDYIDVQDLAEIIYLTLLKVNKNKKMLINCGYCKPYSVKQIIKEFSNAIDRKIKINYLSRRKVDIERIFANNSLMLKKFPKWKQKKNISDSVNASLIWERYLSERFNF